MTRRLLAALVLVLSLALPVLAAEEITLVVWDWQGFRNDQLKPYAEEYSRLNPHIKFEFQIVPLAQYPDRLTAALAAGVAPDLLHFHNKYTSQFVPFLEPFPEDLFPIEKMREEYLAFDQAFIIDEEEGRFYFLPAGIMTGVIFYNKDLWVEGGLEPDIRTWDELRVAGRKLTRRADDGTLEIAGLSLRGAEWTGLTDMIYQQGGWLFNKDGTRAYLDTPEARRAYEYFSEVFFVDRSSNLHESGFDIARGNIATQYKWAWYREPLDESDVNYGVMAIPTFTGSMLPAVGRNNYEPSFAVPKGLKPGHTEAAFEFLRWLYEQDGYHIEINKGRIPGKLSLWSHDAVRFDPTLQVLATMAPYTIFPGELPGYQWEQPMGALASDFVNQKNAPEILLKQTEDLINARLAETPAAWVVERRYTPPGQ